MLEKNTQFPKIFVCQFGSSKENYASIFSKHTTLFLKECLQFGTHVKFRWSRDRNDLTAENAFSAPCFFFLRWNSNLQQVDFSQGFASNNILGLVVLAVNDGFLHLHTCVISPFFCLHFCHLEIQI